MNPDELKQAWQTAKPRLTIDVDLLLKEVQRNEQDFLRTIFWRDVQEVSVSLVMVPVWFYLGTKWSLPWAWYLGVPALLWIAGFMLMDRMRQKRQQPRLDATLGECIESSLAQVEHQIWLLRNVFWWYLLPPGAAILAFFVQVGWLAREGGWKVGLGCAGLIAVEVIVLGGVYWLNQNSVRSELEPRRQELRALLASLTDAYPVARPGGGAKASVLQAERMKWRQALWIVLLGAITAILSLWAYQKGKREPAPFDVSFCPVAGDAVVTNAIISIRQKHRLPAIAAAVVTSKGLGSVGVAGARKLGSKVGVTLEDKWHLGSDGKAMTATLVARLVEQNRLKWDTSVAEVFPDLSTGFHPDARNITVLQLLSHRSGLPANPNLVVYGGADGTKERLRLVHDALGKAPRHKPGTHYEYSNLGYSIVGAITERITGKTWEQAMQDEVFGPLGMATANFGGTGTPGLLDQPWGHDSGGHPVGGNGPAWDNPPVLSPAGRIHCTIQDWARFITDQLRGARGEPALLKPETYQKLHTPPLGGDYALGWLAIKRDWGGGVVLNHGGDNTMNFANVWVAPKRDFAILICINQSGDTAFEASDEAIGTLIELHSHPGLGGQTKE